MEELKFTKGHCYIDTSNHKRLNKDNLIYICKECDYICVLEDINEFDKTVAKHCYETQHTMKRIW